MKQTESTRSALPEHAAPGASAVASPAPSAVAHPRLRPALAGGARWVFLAFVIIVLYGPLVVLAVFSFSDSIIISLPLEGFTTRWYADAVSNPLIRESLKNSVAVAAITTPIALTLGTLAAFAMTRFRYRGRAGVAGLTAGPLVVPWLLIGVGGLLFFNTVNVPLNLRSVGLMHIVVSFPLVAAIVSARLLRFDRDQEEAALDLGATRREVLRYIVLPHLAPALAAAAILAFSYSFNNFVISFFVSGFELTFPIWVFSTLRHAQNVPIVNAISTLVSVAQLLIVYGAWVYSRRRAARRGAEMGAGDMLW